VRNFLKTVTAGVLGTAVLAIAGAASADGPSTGFLTSYYDVASSTIPTASGYGGSGGSGGVGDALVHIINPDHEATQQLGTQCAMIYVFDDIEEMQACCGCPVTPDGVRTLSVINNLTSNFGVNRANLIAGVVDVIGAAPNMSGAKAVAVPPQITTIGLGAGGLVWSCDPSGQFGPTVGQNSTYAVPVPGLVAYQTHTEGNVPTPASRTLVKGTAVEEFASAQPDEGHLVSLQNLCYQIIQNNSGSGSCSCGSGDKISIKRARN